MKLWLDTEFNEFRGALISMALVSEGGEEWYESLGCDDPGPWVAVNVMPIIGRQSIGARMFRVSLQEFLAQYDAIHVIADWPEDIAHFCQSLIVGPGQCINTPRMTFEIRRDINAPSALPHNALADARGIKAEYLRLESVHA